MEGKTIKDWYNKEIDRYRDILTNSHNWIRDYQERLSENLDIKNLKIKFTGNIWYFIEVPKGTPLSIEAWFIHKQSLSTVHRYSSDELRKYEEEIHSAEELLKWQEYKVFKEIRREVASYYSKVYQISREVSYLDFLSSWAFISKKSHFCTPVFWNNSTLDIKNGKHPVISEKEKDFISNSAYFSKSERVHIITWPNMWWKSTFLRQNALLILLAHMWYDVPATAMTTPIVDKIFSRVWSGDNLYLGQSTFMVEMQEISFILRSSTKNSFIIIDEIGRGTSTIDGMSIAWAILEYIHNILWAKCIFATHYHELIDHAGELKSAKNFSVAVWENTESIVFLRKIIPWGIKKSYGIEVAKLAWIHSDVLLSARNMMKHLETQDSWGKQLQIQVCEEVLDEWEKEISREPYIDELLEIVEKTEPNAVTPLDALHILSEIKELVKKKK